MKVKTPGDGSGVVGRFIITVLIILVILLVTVFFAVRTRGGHDFVEERLTKHLGVDVTVKRMRVGWPYALVLEDLRAKGFDEEGTMSGFSAQEVRLGPSWHGRYRVFIRRGHLRLVESTSPMWAPTYFARLGALPYGDLADLSRLGPVTSGHVNFELNGGRIEWSDQAGQLLASAHGISYRLTPVRIPGRRMQHHALSLYSMTRPNGARMTDVSREWLSSDTIPHVELVDTQLEGMVAP